jgi:hypothetical protein
VRPPAAVDGFGGAISASCSASNQGFRSLILVGHFLFCGRSPLHVEATKYLVGEYVTNWCDMSEAKRKFRFPLIALFLLMFYLAGLLSGLSVYWMKKHQYEQQQQKLQRMYDQDNAVLQSERRAQIEFDEWRLRKAQDDAYKQ